VISRSSDSSKNERIYKSFVKYDRSKAMSVIREDDNESGVSSFVDFGRESSFASATKFGTFRSKRDKSDSVK
jgi:hypothetical protein